MKYCIIDDEPIAHRIIEGYCAHLPSLEKVGNCYDAFAAMQLLNQTAVDLLFLDINMPKLTGFDLIKTMPQSPTIIVTSAYREFALEGYELNVSDYLLKPFSLERFLKAVNKVMAQQSPILVNPSEKKEFRFFLKGDKKMHQLHAKDILFVEAYGNYSKVVTAEDTIITHEKISDLEGLLPYPDFLRVHKSFIVATEKISTIEGNRIKIQEHLVPIGQTYKQPLKQLMGKG